MKNLIRISSVIILLGSTYAAGGTWEILNMPGATETSVQDIDGDKIIGIYRTSGSSRPHGFVYDGETWTTIDVPGALETQPFGIDGDVIVGECYDASYHYHGFRYDGSTWATLDMPGAGETWLFGIDGENIVGEYSVNSPYRAFLYDGAIWTGLDVPWEDNICAFDIDGGNIVGSHGSMGGEEAFIYKDGALAIFTRPGAMFTDALAIDGSNIVGGYYMENGGYHGYLYDGTNWTDLIMPDGTEVIPTGISGDKIAGYYFDEANGSDRGFVYTVPEPATLLLFALGGLALRGFDKLTAGRRR